MKKINFLLILVLTIFYNNSYSQERINKELPKISPQIIGQLTSAKGWMYNPEGEWISRQNKIPAYLSNQNKILLDYQDYGLGTDNFISYQLREIKISNQDYLILIKKYKDGSYRYPSINEGWENYNTVSFYVFDKTEFSKLTEIKTDSINIVKIPLKFSSWILRFRNETYLTDIQKEINKLTNENNAEYESKNSLVFQIAPYKEKNIVQFQIFTSYSEYNIIGGVAKEFRTDKYKDIYLTNELFKHCYYETDYLNFNKFIKINQ